MVIVTVLQAQEEVEPYLGSHKWSVFLMHTAHKYWVQITHLSIKQETMEVCRAKYVHLL